MPKKVGFLGDRLSPSPSPSHRGGAWISRSSVCGSPPSRTKTFKKADRGLTGGLVVPVLDLLGAEANTSEGNTSEEWWFSRSRCRPWQVRSTVELSVLL